MPTSSIDRRQFLRWSAASLSAAGLSAAVPGAFRRTLAWEPASDRKVLVLFLRGGMDAVQAVVPFGDQGISGRAKTYAEARPQLAVSPDEAHDLNGFASLHPSLQDATADGPKVADIFRGSVDERPGQLAVLHRVGYASQNRSHFSSQQFWENGVPGAVNLEQGVLNRYVTEYDDPASPLHAVTLDTSPMVLLKGDTLLPVLRSVDDYSLPSNVALGSLPSADDPLGSGLRGAYAQSGFRLDVPGNALTYSTGSSLLSSLQFFEDNVQSEPYEPEPDAAPYYAAMTDRRFAGFVQDCARLLKQVDSLQVAGTNQLGYDTHGAEDRSFPVLMRNLGLALTALYHDLKPIWERTLVVTMSEFGRTSEQNGNLGTDHGESTAMFALGGGVQGGVYNCDRDTWANGDLFSTPEGRYVAHRTDFRQIYAEIISRHLGDPDGRVDAIIPGYSALSKEFGSSTFAPLGFLG